MSAYTARPFSQLALPCLSLVLTLACGSDSSSDPPATTSGGASGSANTAGTGGVAGVGGTSAGGVGAAGAGGAGGSGMSAGGAGGGGTSVGGAGGTGVSVGGAGGSSAGGAAGSSSGGAAGAGGTSSCPLTDHVPTTCSDDGECADGEGCLRGVCIELCGETVAGLDAGLEAGITPWAHLCSVRRNRHVSYVFDDGGCQRAYIYSLNLSRAVADTDLSYALRRVEVDPAGAGDDPIGDGSFPLDGGASTWTGLYWARISPDGSTIAFGTQSVAGQNMTLGRISTVDGQLTLGPSVPKGGGRGAAWIDDDHLIVPYDADDSAGFDPEWAVVSFSAGTVAPLLTADNAIQPRGMVALPGRGALLAGTSDGNIYAVSWSDVTSAVANGTTINLSTSATVLSGSADTTIHPLSSEVVAHTTLQSDIYYQALGDLGPSMLSGPVLKLTAADDPTYWGSVVSLGGKRVALNLLLSAMVVDLP